MKAIILAAGYATRLYPLTLNTSKALLNINNKPIINYIMEQIEDVSEINQVFVISNHKFADQFETWSKESAFKVPLKIIDDGTSDVESRLGAIGDILFTIEKENIEEEIVVIAGDNLFTFSLKEYFKYYKDIDKDCVCVKEHYDLELLKQFGVAVLDENSKVIDLEEKPANPKSNTAVYATYMYKKDTLPLFREYINQGNKPDAPGHFAEWLIKQKEVYAYRFNEECYDIGTKKSLEEVSDIFAMKEKTNNQGGIL